MPPVHTAIPASPYVDQATVDGVRDFVLNQLTRDETPMTPRSHPLWRRLRELGTELWLDTGYLDDASRLWTSEFTALTTNNTLLNVEVQRGAYDSVVHRAATHLSDLDPRWRTLEIAFILNVHHGLRLARRFGGLVSVELHTRLAADVEHSVFYGLRAWSLCPEQFVVKIPLTPAGLIAARRLREAGVPVNLTLGFSARHNLLAAATCFPSYVNVFLGRIGAYLKDNKLGDGAGAGERALLASQRIVRAASQGRAEPIRQIAASMRDGAQVASLAGGDVFTMPVKVADEALKTLDPASLRDHSDDQPAVTLAAGVDAQRIGLGKLWDVSPAERSLAEELAHRPARTAEELVDRVHAAGCGDLFPRLSAHEHDALVAPGKIPQHAPWAERIAAGELAIDTMLNLAGLASFTVDQQALDDRIERVVAAR